MVGKLLLLLLFVPGFAGAEPTESVSHGATSEETRPPDPTPTDDIHAIPTVSSVAPDVSSSLQSHEVPSTPKAQETTGTEPLVEPQIPLSGSASTDPLKPEAQPEPDTTPAPPSVNEPKVAQPPTPATAPASQISILPIPTQTPLSPLEILWPQVPLHGINTALLLLFFTFLGMIIANLARRLQNGLAPHGLLPGLAHLVEQGARITIVGLLLGAIAAITPSWLTPALGLVILMVAAGIGWSVRDVLPDVMSGVVLASERRIRPGQWISGEGYAGVVASVGLRVTWLKDEAGQNIALPNRILLKPVRTGEGRWPAVEVLVQVPSNIPALQVRKTILDAVLLSPWVAFPAHLQTIQQNDAGQWRVRVRLLEGRYAERFSGALREHISEVLLHPSDS